MDSSISNTAFQEALQRARQLAAKIGQPGGGGGGMKRPNDDDDFDHDSKRANFDQISSKLSEMKNSNKPQRGQLYLNGIVHNGEKTLDYMIPGNKVGFVIGKGGEMIRTLQDKAGVKMVIYQETSEMSDRDKQLRITGPPDKCDYAKQLVVDLLVEKDMEAGKMRNDRGGGGGFKAPVLNEYGSSSRITYFEYPVSPQLIGLVIGKGGETIRKIQADSGCKVQFDTAKLDPQGNKICQFTGSQDSVNKAVDMVKEIIDTITGGQGSVEEIRLVVPTSRTGTVIGRGGETIRALKQQSGCNIELDKSYSSDNDEKCFILRGTADKITYAQQLVTDKVGGHATVLSSTVQNNPLYGEGPYGGYLASQIYNNQVAGGSSSSANQQYYWGGQPAADGSKSQDQSADQYAMWAAYYAQYYSQTNSANGAGAAAAAASSSSTTGAAGQSEESVYVQWIEYYKAYGMTKEAEDMEVKLKEYRNAKKNSEDGKNNSHQNGNSE